MTDHLVTASTAATELADESAPVDRPTAVDEVVVLDYGGQYSQLIARRVRECGVFSELLPHHVGAEEVRKRAPKGLILSGGPASVYADGAPKLDPELLELGIPVLGICYGMQLLALKLGGKVEGAEVGEFGRSQLTVRESGTLLAGLPLEQSCWMSHRDTVFEAPPGFTALASSTASPVAAFESVRARDLRDPVPPRGRPHALRDRRPQEVPRRRLRRRAELVGRLDRRGAARAHPRPGRRREGHLRPERRRRLLGRRSARPPGDRRPAHLHLRRPRPDAKERGRAGHQGLPRPVQDPAGRRRRREPLPREARRRRRARGQAQDHRRRVHPRLRGGGRQDRRREVPRPGHALLRRDRVGRRHGRGRRSSPITTSAACPTTWSSSSSSRSARSSRTRSAPSVPSSACPSASSGASPSRAPAWRSASSAARPPSSGWTSCATPTTSSRTRSATPASTASCGSRSASCPTSAPSASRATSAPTATSSSSAR